MPNEQTFSGTIVEKDPKSPFPVNPGDGLYLLTEDGRVLALVTGNMAAQMPLDMLHRTTRSTFEPYIGKSITIKGYLSGSTLYSAIIVN